MNGKSVSNELLVLYYINNQARSEFFYPLDNVKFEIVDNDFMFCKFSSIIQLFYGPKLNWNTLIFTVQIILFSLKMDFIYGYLKDKCV